MPPNYNETWVKLTAAAPVPIVEIDISQAGGLLEARRTADLARTCNLRRSSLRL
jgi:L-alanine-DL-glutamate epimerase-like enolase superfamily enzyme